MFLSKEEFAETIWACRYCPMCQIADRLAQVVRRESYSPRGRGAIIFALEKGLIQWDDGVADIMYSTLNDGILREWCVGNYDHEELVLETRASLFAKGLAPAEVKTYIDTLKTTGAEGNNQAKAMADAGVETKPGADMLLFGGCSSAERSSSMVTMGKLFHLAGVPFQCLPKEPCCGWPLYQLGDIEGARDFSSRVADAIRASGASTVVTLDADCHRMLLTRTSRLGGNLEGIKIVHASTLLAEWIESGKLKIVTKISEPTTYHDPCSLARYCDETDAPRAILSAVLENEVREMTTNRKLANCCGAGGMLPVYKPDISDKIALLRLKEAQETGASLLITGCTRCDETLRRPDKEPSSITVSNIVDVVGRAAGLEE